MAGQGFLFKILSNVGSYRSALASRASVVSYQQNAGVRKLAAEKLEAMDIQEKPKRPLSPYFRFLQDHRSELIKQNPKLKVTEVTVKCAHDWRNIDEAKKEKYKEEYKAEMSEYIRKHLEYISKLTDEQKGMLKSAAKEKAENRRIRKLRQANRDAGKPKGIRTAYIFFLQEKSKAEKKPLNELLKSAKSGWLALSEEEKRRYVELYEDDKKRYELEMSAWEKKMVKDGNTALIRQSSLLETKPKLKVSKKKSPK